MDHFPMQNKMVMLYKDINFKALLGIYKVLLLLNEHGDPPFFISKFKFL